MLLTNELTTATEIFKSIGFLPWLLATVALCVLVLRLIKLGKDLMDAFGLEKKSIREKADEKKRINAHSELLEDLQSTDKKFEKSLTEISEKLTTMDDKLTQLSTDLSAIKTDVTNLQDATIEDLYDCINRKCKYYMYTVHGVPDDERDSFIRLFEKYTQCGGNHGLGDRVNYCLNNLPRLQVVPTACSTTTITTTSIAKE